MALDQASSGIRQAAILLASVDSATARQLMQQMPPAMVKAVRKAMVELGRIDSNEQQAVLAAFHSSVRKTGMPTKAEPALNRTEATHATARSQEPSLHSEKSIPFTPAANDLSQSPWGQYSTEQILDCIITERPTVVAVVLSQLDPSIANQILGKLPSQLKTEVLLQLSKLQHIEADILHDIKEQLQSKLATTRPSETLDSDLGLPKLKSILEAGSEKMKAELCQALQLSTEVDGSLKVWLDEQLRSVRPSVDFEQNADDPIANSRISTDDLKVDSGKSLASSINSPELRVHRSEEATESKRSSATRGKLSQRGESAQRSYDDVHFDAALATFEFDDLKQADLNHLALILQNCDPRALLISLSGADEELMQRVSLLFSSRDWKRLKERLRSLGNISVDDQIMARRFVAEAAQSLIDEAISHKASIKTADSETYAKAA